MLPLLLLALPAGAATLTVAKDGSGSYTSIQTAIDAASSGDTISVGPGTYKESLDLSGKTLTIASTSGAEQTVLDAQGRADQAITIASGEGNSTALSGLTVHNEGARGVYVAGVNATFQDMIFEELGATGVDMVGGAVYAVAASPTFIGTTFSQNQATYGGHIAQSGGTLTLDGTEFISGDADYGGAFYGDQAGLRVSGTTFSGNGADVAGGALYLTGQATVLVEDSVFDGNDAESGGGAVYATGVTDTMAFNDTAFTDNSSYDAHGGAIHLTTTSPADFSGCTFEDNVATYAYGGALWATYAGDVSVSGSSFMDNVSYNSGGAIAYYYAYGTLTVTDSTFYDNVATYGNGGGIYSYVYGNVTLTDVTMDGNEAYQGGGLYAYYGMDVDIDGTTFVDNVASVYAGGGAWLYYAFSGYTIDLRDTRFERNSAPLEGGGLVVRSSVSASLTRVAFVDNSVEEGGYGGGLHMASNTTETVHRSVFAGNVATYGGGAYDSLVGTGADWTNNIFQENRAATGGAVCFVEHAGVDFGNNTLVANLATTDAGGICLYAAYGDYVNNVISHTSQGAAIHSWDLNSGFYSSFRFNNFYANTDGDLAGELLNNELDEEGTLGVEPGYATLSLNDDPDDDSLVLARDSALIDAGAPDLLDADGTRSDIGAFGGPWWTDPQDADGDGWDESTDCDDGDATVYPGADETWYDGVNSDCASTSDDDADADGLDAAAHGGTDCDDTDPAVLDDCGDAAGDSGSADVPGGQNGEPAQAGCGCAAVGIAPPPLAMWLLLPLWARRRR